jgi:pyruvate ferredoxin oxidoreductase alpha subunit
MADKKFMEGPLKGNYAAAYAAMDANVQVITSFPITPQTTVVEKISELIGEKEFIDRGQKTEYVKMESEHSVMASLVAASIAGARTYTATSGQGLLYMAEMVHWAAGTRLPLVCSIASRGIAPPWNIWADFSDIVNMRDSGVMIQFLGSHQEIYDSILMAYNITEHPDVLLPMFPAYGGFKLSHTSKIVKRIPFEDATKFIRAIPKNGWPHIWMDAERPIMHGNLIMPQGYYTEFRIKIHEAQMKAKQVIKDTMAAFKKQFGRGYGNGLIEPYRAEDAEVLLVGVGQMGRQAEDAVDVARKEGLKAGAIRLRTYRPFPTEDLIEYAKKCKYIGVVDRAITYGSPTAGPVSTDLMAVCQRDPDARDAHIIPFVAGLGGRDVSLEEQVNQIKLLIEYKETGKEPSSKEKMFGTFWTGLLHGKPDLKGEQEEYHGDI